MYPRNHRDPRVILRNTMFGTTTIPKDYILEVLKLEIEDYCLSSYDTFDIHVSVHPSPNATYNYGSNGVWVGHTAYIFEHWTSLPQEFQILVRPSGRPVYWDKVLKTWLPLEFWLRRLKPVPRWYELPNNREWADLSKERLAHQFRWWMANGKHFPLLKLPGEIREIIYDHVFPDTIDPCPKSPARRYDRSQRAVLARNINFDLLLTCKQVMSEASKALFSRSTFFVQHAAILRQVTLAPPLQSRVRRLIISFTHEQYLSLFRSYTFDPIGQLQRNKSPSAEAFKFMQLDSLRLLVHRPVAASEQNNMFAGKCQKKFVDWLMSSAWPFVRGQIVEIVGVVKSSQAKEFKEKCKAFKAAFKMWNEFRVADGKEEGRIAEYLQEIDGDDDGGVLLDEAEREQQAGTLNQAQRLMHPDLTCTCRIKCSPELFDYED